jgi:hypothetical protein
LLISSDVRELRIPNIFEVERNDWSGTKVRVEIVEVRIPVFEEALMEDSWHTRGKRVLMYSLLSTGLSGKGRVDSELIPSMVAWGQDKAAWSHRMILQVFSDAREVNQALDAEIGEQVLIADPGKLQKLWCIENTSREDNLFRRVGGVDCTTGIVRDSSCRVKTRAVLSGVEDNFRSLGTSKHDEIGLAGIGGVIRRGSIRSSLSSWVDRALGIINPNIVSGVLVRVRSINLHSRRLKERTGDVLRGTPAFITVFMKGDAISEYQVL